MNLSKAVRTLDDAYKDYLDARATYYPEREKLGFGEFVETVKRWEKEYDDAWKVFSGEKEDERWEDKNDAQETIDELERLLCV